MQDLEERFSDTLWRKDVHDIVDEHLHQLRHWEAYLQPKPERDVPKTYRLDEEERKFPSIASSHPPIIVVRRIGMDLSETGRKAPNSRVLYDIKSKTPHVEVSNPGNGLSFPSKMTL